MESNYIWNFFFFFLNSVGATSYPELVTLTQIQLCFIIILGSCFMLQYMLTAVCKMLCSIDI